MESKKSTRSSDRLIDKQNSKKKSADIFKEGISELQDAKTKKEHDKYLKQIKDEFESTWMLAKNEQLVIPQKVAYQDLEIAHLNDENYPQVEELTYPKLSGLMSQFEDIERIAYLQKKKTLSDEDRLLCRQIRTEQKANYLEILAYIPPDTPDEWNDTSDRIHVNIIFISFLII